METKAETRRGSTGGTMNLGSKLNLGKVLSKNRRLNIGAVAELREDGLIQVMATEA